MAKFIRLLFVTFFFAIGANLSQNTLLAQSASDEEKAKLLYADLYDKFARNKLDSTYIVANQLLEFSSTASLPFYTGKSHYFLMRYYLSIGMPDSSLYYCIKSEEVFRNNKDTVEQGVSSFFIGMLTIMSGDENSAMDYYLKAVDLLKSANDTVWLGISSNRLGMIYFRQGNYIPALKHMLNSIEAFKLKSDSSRLGGAYNNLGLVYRKTKDQDKEIEAYLNTIKYVPWDKANVYLGNAYNNLSEVYLKTGEIEKGFEALEKSKEIFERIEHPLGLCGYYAVLSYYYIHLKPPDFVKVIEYSEQCTAISEEYGDFRQYADATSFLGEAYLETNQLEKAKTILEKGLAVAEANNLKDEIVKVTKVLAEVYHRDKQPEKAFQYLKKYIQQKDSLLSEEKIKEFTSMDLGFRFKQQQLSDSLKNEQHRMEMEFQHENEIKTQRQLNYFFLIVSLLVVAFAIYMVFARRRIHKANLLLGEQNQLINNQKIDLEKSNEKLGQAISKLKEMDEYKQAMVNMIVHDLKNPLNVLVNIDAFEDKTEQQAIIKYTSKQMLNLIMNMLDVNHAENNTIQLKKSEISFNEIARASIQDVNFLCTQENIEIKNTIAFDFTIDADCDLLIRVFVNLFTNAIKFSPANSKIILAAQSDASNRLVISVEDHGQGISPENHALIFEKFRQVNRVKSGNIGSTGLGLAFCKMAVELHGWEIGVDSAPGKGAKFWIKMDTFKRVEKQNATLDVTKSVKVLDGNFDITNEDFIKLKPYMAELKKHGVFAVSDFKETIIAIENLKIAGLKNWLYELRSCVTNLDEEKFVKLLDVFKR